MEAIVLLAGASRLSGRETEAVFEALHSVVLSTPK